MVFDMRKDKILFVFERYKYNDNKASAIENLSFLSIISFVVIIFFKFIVENSDEESLDMDFSKDTRKRSTFTFKALKEKMI